MKKFTLVIGIMILSGAIALGQAENRFSGGFYAGVVGAQIDGDAQYGFYHGGFNLSATAQYPISNNFFLSLEIGFAQKGARDKPSAGYPSLYHVTINYADIPLLIHYYDRKRVGLYAGLEFSRRLSGLPFNGGVSPGGNYPTTFRGIDGALHNNDYEYVVGGSYYFTPNISLDVRYCYSIVAMGGSSESLYRDFGIYNNLIQIRMGYIFGMPFDKKKDKNPQ